MSTADDLLDEHPLTLEEPFEDLPPETNMAFMVSKELLQILVCPVTKKPLKYDRKAQELISEEAGLAYPVRDGIPIMLANEARKIR